MSPSLQNQPAQTQATAPMPPEQLTEIGARWKHVPAGERPHLTVTGSSSPGVVLDALSHAAEDVAALLAQVEWLQRSYIFDTADLKRQIDEREASVFRRVAAKLTELHGRLKAGGDPDYKGVTPAIHLVNALADSDENEDNSAPAPARSAIFPDGKAAFLARKLSEEKAVVSATAINATTVDLHVQPASLDEWEFWQRLFHVEPGKATHRGSFATERDRIGGAR